MLEVATKPTKYYAALTRAITEEMARDENVILVGEDVGESGGIFAQTKGVFAKFGAARVRDMPVAEAGFVSMAVGAAMTGLRPIVEIGFEDFLTACMDPIVNQAAKLSYMLGGQVQIPVTIYTFGGGGLNAGPQHSQSLAAWFAHVPGIKVVMPSSAADVLGLMKAAIRDDNMVLCLLSKQLIPSVEAAPAIGSEHVIEIGKAAVKRRGDAATIVAMGAMTPVALEAAGTLAQEGIETDVLDLRTISPMDTDAILASVARTGRLCVVHEAMAPCGIGAEILARVSERLPVALKAPPVRVTPPFAPSPFAPALEAAYRPDAARIAQAVRSMLDTAA